MERIVALVDMDCFYVQVEQRIDPSLKGKPCAVVQYNPWKGGGIIAVSYEARDFGVTRNMRGDDAKAKCPDMQLVRVPLVRGKADLTRYREAGAEVIEVLSRFSDCVERASVDEAYIDLTDEVDKRMRSLDKSSVTIEDLPNTHVVGYNKEKDNQDLADWLSVAFDAEVLDNHNKRLAIGAVIAEEMRAAVYSDTGFRCSAGIAHNKMLGKLACGFHKPNKQTILPQSEVPGLFTSLPIRKIRNLGGKMGLLVSEHLQAENMGDLQKYSMKVFQQLLGDKNGAWLYDVVRGFDHEPVTPRQLPKSVGCSKNFTGKNALNTREEVKFWLSQLAKEVAERLEKDKVTNKRTAKSLTLSVRYASKPHPVSASRVCAIIKYDATKFSDDTFVLAQQFNNCPAHQPTWSPSIVCLGLSAGKFQEDSTSGVTIGEMFARNDVSMSQSMMQTQSSSNCALFQGKKEKQSVLSGDSKNAAVSSADKNNSIASFFKAKSESHLDSSIELKKETKINMSTKPVEKTLKSFFRRKELETQTGLITLESIDSKKCDPMSQSVYSSLQDESSNSSLNSPYKNNQMTPEKNDNSVLSFFKRKQLERCNKNLETSSQGTKNVRANLKQNSSIGPEIPVPKHQAMPDNISSISLDLTQINQQNRLVNHPENLNSPDCVKPEVLDVDHMRCEKCSTVISIWEMPEHMDFHFAQDLQKDLNSASGVSGPQVNAEKTAKRKSLSDNDKTGKKMKLNHSQGRLTSFFNKTS